MTWIRVDSTLPSEAFIGHLAEALGVKIPTAVGMYVSTVLGFAEYEKTGIAANVTTSSLEQWARWPGKPGRYAAAFRKHCVETRDDQPDRKGTCKLWWKQEALLAKALRDAARLRDERKRETERREKVAESSRDDSASVAGSSRLGRAANVDVDVDVDDDGTLKALTTTTGTGTEVERAVAYVTLCVAACNRGLRENVSIRTAFNEVAASAQDVHREWIESGIPVDVAVAAIYDSARKYRVVGRHRQPTTLRYFDNAVREAWEQKQARSAESSVDVSLDDVNADRAALALVDELMGESR